MTPTEIYISANAEKTQVSDRTYSDGCLVTKFDIEMKDISWTTVLTDKIENKCRRVVVDYQSNSNPVQFLVSRTSPQDPFDLLKLELDSTNGDIVQTKIILSGGEDYYIKENSNHEYVVIEVVSSDDKFSFYKYDKSSKTIV